MSFWQSVVDSAGMGPHYLLVLLCCGTIGLLLGALVPEARSRLRGSLLLLVLSFCAMLICGLLFRPAAVSLPISAQSAWFRWLHFFAQVLFAVAVVNLGGTLLFNVILKQLRLEPAPILRDTILGLAYVVVSIMLLSRNGVDLSGVVATSAVVTAIIGFSLQDTLGM